MTEKLVAFFVESATEVAFYKAVVINAQKKLNAPYACSFQYVDMKGIGNFKSDALRQFRLLKKKHPDQPIDVFLCIDRDVFDLQKKPPIDKASVKKSLIKEGAQKVEYIEAKQSIEDWFLCDYHGVISYLGLPTKTKRPEGTGQEALKKLFLKAGKVYVKGGNAGKLIEYLDISGIMNACCSQFKPLCETLGLECKKEKKCRNA